LAAAQGWASCPPFRRTTRTHCIGCAKAHHHPALTEQTIWEVFETERPKLVPYAAKFDGFHAICLVRFDNNKYSVAANEVGCPVEVHAYTDRIVIPQTDALSPSIPVHLAWRHGL
jgi:hypothetical protein